MRLWLVARRLIGSSRFVGLVLLVALTGLRFVDPLPLEALRLRVFDFYQVMQPRVITSRPVTIVDIDETSLKQLGQWPWPRTVIADLVTRLASMGAVAIGFDVFFPEPDRMSPALAAATFRDLDDETRKKLAALPDNDAIFAQAIHRARVVLARTGLPTASADTADDDLVQTGVAALGEDPSPFLFHFPGLLHNLPLFENAASGRGLVTIPPERDGIVRRVQLAMVVDDAAAPSLTIEMLRVATGADSIMITTDAGGIRSIGVPKLKLPTDGKGQVWPHFARHDPDKFVSASAVLDGTVAANLIAGKLVLIGTSALGLLDNKTTPVEAAMPGVEVHAQILESALNGSLLSYPLWAPLVEILAAALISLALIVWAPRLGAETLFLAGAIVAAFIVAASWYAYAEHRLMLDATYPLGSTFTIFLAMVATNYINEQNAKRKIRSAFGQYLSPDLVQQLANSPEKLVLGGEERRMSIMFSDVRGFTALAETYKHDPQGLTKLMNRFLTPLTNAILARKGTIDKYMGDAIMAFWNAPLDDTNHEVNACLAAIDMLACIERLNTERKSEADHGGHSYMPIKIGIGINSGVCVVGNMGSDLRFDYSVLGDSVNLASRIESQCKDYAVSNIIGAATAGAAANVLPLLELDRIRVKGKREPEAIYTVLGGPDLNHKPETSALLAAHARMLQLYRSKEFGAAAEAVEGARLAASARFDLDGLYDVFARRCRDYAAEPPHEGWDGTHTATSK